MQQATIGAEDTITRALYRLGAALACANANAVFQRQNKDLAVPNFALVACATAPHDCVDCRLHEFLVNGNL